MVAGSKHDDVGVVADLEAAAVDEAVELGRHVGDQVDGLLERQQALLPDGLAEQHGGVVEGGQHVEVGAGVGGADDGPAVAPHVEAELPLLVGRARRVGAEAGEQVVGERDVAQHVERVAALLGGDLADGAPDVLPVLRLHDVEDALGGPVGQPDASGPGDLACSSSFVAGGRVGEDRRLLGLGSVITCSQPGRASSTKPAANDRRMPNGFGMVRATTLPPLARATSPAESWFSMFGGARAR